jgi:hypothetical protein
MSVGQVCIALRNDRVIVTFITKVSPFMLKMEKEDIEDLKVAMLRVLSNKENTYRPRVEISGGSPFYMIMSKDHEFVQVRFMSEGGNYEIGRDVFNTKDIMAIFDGKPAPCEA